MKCFDYNEKSHTPFDSSMLKIGEMMEIKHNSIGTVDAIGHKLLRTYDGFVDLNSPSNTWDLDQKIKGRKLEPGESVVLIQE